MTDRQPTQVLANGAIRYGIYRADGTLDHYEYLRREDAPTVEGTPLSKANLLSDATASKLWPGSNKPEDPTVNQAFEKLSKGMHLVGDIELTSRAAPSSAWLPCDGRYVSQEDYPELFDVLRTSASQGNWETQVVNADTSNSKLGDVISYANGVWFRSRAWIGTQYPEEYITARMWYSLDNMNSWHEVAVQNNVLQINTIHYYAQKYVGVCLKYVSNRYYVWYIYYADQPSGPWKLSAQVGEQSEDISSKAFVADIISDGAMYYIVWEEQNSIVYSSNLLASTWTTVDDIGFIRSLTYNEDDGYFYGAKGSENYENDKQIVRARTPTSKSAWQTIYSTAGSYKKVCASGNIIYAANAGTGSYAYVYSTDGGATFKQATHSKITGKPIISDGIVVLSAADSSGANPVLLYSDDLDSDFISTSAPAVASFAGNGSGLIVGALASNGGSTQNIYRDFAYDAKKIPKIVPDSRSHAYIKAVEE